jgi:riboflavin synthase
MLRPTSAAPAGREKLSNVFTGIVEELGRFEGRSGDRYRFAAVRVLAAAAVGDSIAVNGACLTVVQHDDSSWIADVSDETARRTNLGALVPGDPVNLERPVRMADRLGGHVVLGHVDAVGEILSPASDLHVRIPAPLMRYCVEKGSIAVDGISLTIFDVDDDTFRVAIIPHTAAVTTLGSKGAGAAVNIEVDVMAKHVEKLLGAYLPSASP